MSTRFDQLESRSRPTGADLYSPDLLGYSRGATPPSQMASYGQKYKEPPAATFDERFGTYPTGLDDRKRIEDLFQFIAPQPGNAPEYHERFGDPTKVITQIPPSLNAPYGARGLDQLQSMQMAGDVLPFGKPPHRTPSELAYRQATGRWPPWSGPSPSPSPLSVTPPEGLLEYFRNKIKEGDF